MEIKIPYLSKADLENLDGYKKGRLRRLKERIDNNAKALEKWSEILQAEEDADMKIAYKTDDVVNALKDRLDYLVSKFDKLAKRLKVKPVYKAVSVSTASMDTIIGEMSKRVPVRYKRGGDGLVYIDTGEVMGMLNEEGYKGTKEEIASHLISKGALFSYDRDRNAFVVPGEKVKEIPALLGELVTDAMEDDSVETVDVEIPEGFVTVETLEEVGKAKVEGEEDA